MSGADAQRGCVGFDCEIILVCYQELVENRCNKAVRPYRTCGVRDGSMDK